MQCCEVDVKRKRNVHFIVFIVIIMHNNVIVIVKITLKVLSDCFEWHEIDFMEFNSADIKCNHIQYSLYANET